MLGLVLSVGSECHDDDVGTATVGSAVDFDWHHIASVDWWLQHLLDSYRDNPLHMITELVLIAAVLWLIFKQEARPSDVDRLTAREEEELLREWQPEPLSSCESEVECKWSTKIAPLNGSNGATSTIRDDTGEEYIHLASHNYLGFANHPRVIKAARETIEKYSVGSCGPRGFYGTMDVHLNLETALSDYFKRPAIIYTDVMGLHSSAITAFSKRHDLLLIDEACHFLITQAQVLSRSNVFWFQHNDMKSLEACLQSVQEEDERSNTHHLNRRFIITEGLFHNNGALSPLPELVRLKEDYKYRLILDDSHALGVLHPRGSPGYWNVPFHKIDVYISAMDTALGGTGGFCVGSKEITYHQTLSGSGYVFTASSPPFQCSGVQQSLQLLSQNGPKLIQQLQTNAELMHSLLSDKKRRWHITGVRISPLIHLRLTNIDDEIADRCFEFVCITARKNGVLVFPSAYLPQEFDIADKSNPKPSLRIVVTVQHSTQQLETAARVIVEALNNFFDEKMNDNPIPQNDDS